MQGFAILLVIQIILGGLILNTSSNSSSAKIVKYSLKQVLGASSFLAQDVPSDQPTDTPTPNQSNQPTDSSIPTDMPTIDQSQSIDTSVPAVAPDETGFSITSDTSSNPAPNGELTPSPTSTNSITETTTIQGTNTTSPVLGYQDIGNIDTNIGTSNNVPPVDIAIVNSDIAISTSSNISTESIKQAQQQDLEIQNTSNPQQQTQSLLQAAKENVISINDTVQQNNYSTEAFLTQRITDEISKAITNTQTNSPTQQSKILNDVKLFCKQADLTLKTQQLLVPQDLEQDIEIARGLCNNIQ